MVQMPNFFEYCNLVIEYCLGFVICYLGFKYHSLSQDQLILFLF